MKQRGNRFTLLELLIVVAIIAILTGVLLPALNSARASAQKISCLNNQSQTMKGMLLYANDNKDYILEATGVKKNGYPVSWSEVISGEWIAGGKGGIYVPLRSMRCPANPFTSGGGLSAYNVYGLIFLMMGDYTKCRADRPLGNFYWRDDTWNNTGYYLSKMRQPSRTSMIGDSVYGNGTNKGKPYYFIVPSQFYANGAVHLIHRGLANMGFADGHAESMQAPKLRAGLLEFKCFWTEDFNPLEL